MRKIATLGLVTALGMGGTALAAENVSHSYVEAGYGYSELAGGIVDGDGFKVGGSFELPANFVVAASYRDFSYDGVGDLSELSAGVSYKWALGTSFDLLTGASFEQLDDGSDDYTGFALSVGTRGRITETLELDAGLKYQDMEADSGLPTAFSASLGLRKYFTPAFAAGVEVRKAELLIAGETSFIATLRYDFGDLL
jgi:hypothetical protein